MGEGLKAHVTGQFRSYSFISGNICSDLMTYLLQGGWRFEGPCYPTIPELVRHQWQSGEPVTNKSQTILANPIVRESWELNNDDVVLETKIGNVRCLAILCHHMSHAMRKLDFCLGENKGTDQLCSNYELINAFVVATQIVQFLFFANPKFQASSTLL